VCSRLTYRVVSLPLGYERHTFLHTSSTSCACFAQPGQPGPELFWPAIALFINDNPEGQRLCGVYDSMICKFPCRMCGCVESVFRPCPTMHVTCRCSGANLGDPRAGASSALRLRLPSEIRTAQLANYANKTARDKALKAISGAFAHFITFPSQMHHVLAVHPERNAFHGLYFGANVHGIHLAAGPDRMHLMYEGLGNSLLTWTVMVLVKAGP
jgi:hypothetical protein